MKLLRIIGRDFRLGLGRKSWGAFLFLIGITSIICLVYHNNLVVCAQQGAPLGDISFWNYWMEGIKGMSKYEFSLTNSFFIPVFWFCIQLGFHYLIAYYPASDFETYGKNVMLAGKSRDAWWIGKCFWCFSACVIYHVIRALTILIIGGILEHGLTFQWETQTAMTMISDLCRYMTCRDVILCTVIVPFTATLAIAFAQMLLSFLVTPVVSFMMVIGFYIVSAYYLNPYFLGNYTMVLRYSYVNENGLSPMLGLVYSVALILVCVMMGMVYFDGKDVI